MDLNQEIQEICSAHDLWSALADVIQIINRTFHPVREQRTEIDVDPDTDEHRIVLDITIDASVDEMLRRYNQWTRAIVLAIPADKREWIRLCPHPLHDEETGNPAQPRRTH